MPVYSSLINIITHLSRFIFILFTKDLILRHKKQEAHVGYAVIITKALNFVVGQLRDGIVGIIIDWIMVKNGVGCAVGNYVSDASAQGRLDNARLPAKNPTLRHVDNKQ